MWSICMTDPEMRVWVKQNPHRRRAASTTARRIAMGMYVLLTAAVCLAVRVAWKYRSHAVAKLRCSKHGPIRLADNNRPEKPVALARRELALPFVEPYQLSLPTQSDTISALHFAQAKAVSRLASWKRVPVWHQLSPEAKRSFPPAKQASRPCQKLSAGSAAQSAEVDEKLFAATRYSRCST